MKYKDLGKYKFALYEETGERINPILEMEAVELLEEAIGKQMFKHKKDDRLSHTGYRCSKCDTPVWIDEKYCTNCGQRLAIPGNKLEEEESLHIEDIISTI